MLVLLADDHPGRRCCLYNVQQVICVMTYVCSVCAPAQVTTQGGAAVFTMERGEASGPAQRDNGAVWNVTKDFKSGFMSGWNKFCFTGVKVATEGCAGGLGAVDGYGERQGGRAGGPGGGRAETHHASKCRRWLC